MIKVEVKKSSRHKISAEKIREIVKGFLSERGVKEAKVGVVIVGDRKMKQLNEKFRGKKETTDVLSFSQVEGEEVPQLDEVLDLGEVVVSWPQAMKQALDKQVLIEEEVGFLIKHGLLHLLGVHHE